MSVARGKAASEGAQAEVFAFFNEIGILSQLSTALLAKALPEGLHPSHFFIVNHLTRMGDGKTPVRIAEAMQVAKATMTHSLRILERRGLVEARPNPEDGRGKLIFLTEAGRQFRDRAVARVYAAFGDRLGADHLEIMARIRGDLAVLRKHLDENR